MVAVETVYLVRVVNLSDADMTGEQKELILEEYHNYLGDVGRTIKEAIRSNHCNDYDLVEVEHMKITPLDYDELLEYLGLDED